MKTREEIYSYIWQGQHVSPQMTIFVNVNLLFILSNLFIGIRKELVLMSTETTDSL